MKLQLIACSLFACMAAGMFACDKKGKTAEDSSSNTPVQTTSSESAGSANAADKPVMTFGESSFDFGAINEGDTVMHKFAFTNTGKSPLVIQNATAQCGCTVPDWPKEPIAPGATGEIKVVFNSRGKQGPQSKAVTITANTEPVINTVTLQGTVNGVTDMQGPVKAK